MIAQAPILADMPVRSINHIPWMEIPGVRAVVWALGPEHVRFVGGCVRDFLLGRPNLDVDMATPLPPDETMRRLHAAHVRVKPIGIEHGTVVALTSTGQFEITTLRRDVETDGRRATVVFTTDWVEDALRRDFTINALSVDSEGRLFDPCGGLADLEAGRVRFIGDADERIREDVLRLLRFFRFSAWYGRGPMDAAGLAASARAAAQLDRLSGERLSAELHRLLAAPNPAAAVEAMAAHDLLQALTPAQIRPRPLAAFVALEASRGLAPTPVARLAAMLPASADVYAALAERLRFSRKEARRLEALARPLPALGEDEADIRRRLYRTGDRELYRLRALLAAADGDRGDLDKRLGLADGWAWPKFPIGGLDLVELGVEPGPHLGDILNLVEDWWVRRDFAPDRDACLAAIRKSLAADA